MRGFRWLLCLAMGVALVGCPSAPDDDDDDDTTPPAPAWSELPSSLASVFSDEAEDLGATGAAVAIWFDGVLYAGTYGTKEVSGGDAVAPTTLFRIGSTTKMMTSTALLAAVDRGAMAMDDALVDHLPGLSNLGGPPIEAVTLHHLLNHTSGISEITPIDGAPDDDVLQSYTYSGFGFAGRTWMMAPAGSFWNYSNPNFALAGAAVEATDGRWYREIMEADVFEPLGMTRTMFLGDEVEDDGDYARSQSRDWTGQTTAVLPVDAQSYDHAWSRPAGFAWSNVLDMVRWGRFLQDGDASVLSAASHAALIGDQAPMLAFLDYGTYGYGVMRFPAWFADGRWFEVPSLEHGGAIPGYAAELIVAPERGLVMATLAAGDGAYFGRLRARVWEELLGASEATMPAPGIDVANFPNLVGTYVDPFNVGVVHVTLDDDGQLEWELPDLDALDIPYGRSLSPTARGAFRVSIQGAPTGISFIAADGTQAGEARWIRHRAFVADREAVVARDLPLDPARLRAALAPRL